MILLFEKFLSLIRGAFYSFVLNYIYKNCKIGSGLRIGKGCRIRVRKNSRIVIGSKVVIGDGVKISALNGGSIIIENNVGVGDYSQMVSHNKILIKNNCNIAPHVYVFDHDHIYDLKGVNRNEFISSPIIIGKKCWICTNSVILRGSEIGDYSVVAAGSIVKEKIDSHVVFYQERTKTIRTIKE